MAGAGPQAPAAPKVGRSAGGLRLSGPVVGALVGVLALAAVVGVLVVLMGGGGGEEEALTVLAMNEDPEGSPQAVLYVGDPEERPLELPEGEYSLLAMDEGGNIAEVRASLASDGLVPLSEIDFGSGATEEARTANRENMGKLLELFAVNDYSVLSYTERMLRTGGDLSDDDVAAQFDEMAQLQASLEKATDGLQYFIEESSARRASPLYVRAMAPTLSSLPSPTPGKVSLLWAWWQWAKSLSGAGEDTRGKIAEGMAALPDDNHRQQLLNGIDPERRRALGIPDNASDFLNKLKSGELDNNANQIHQELCRASTDPSADLERLADYYDQAQKTGSRPIDQAHKHGEIMVEQGTRFYLEAIKEIIGVAEGPEKVKKFLSGAIDKGSLIYDLLSKPGETLSKEGIKKILEGELKGQLQELGISEDEADGIIGVLTDKVFDKLMATNPGLVEAPKATPAGKAVLGPSTPESVQAPVTPPPAVTAIPTLVPTRAPTAATATETAEEETPTPAPDTSWIEGFVQGIADQWLAEGYSGIDVAVYADDLRQCLADEVAAGAGRDEAIAACPPSMFEPVEETPPLQPTEAPPAVPPPEPTEVPPPPPTAPPQGQQVTAVGVFIPTQWDNEPTENYIRLEFNTAGGPVSGTGKFQYIRMTEEGVQCFCTWEATFTGTYFPETGRLEGRYNDHVTHLPYVFQCGEDYQESGRWEATLEGNRITGSEVNWRGLELTVQG